MKKETQLDGQICLDLNTNTKHFVAQANELISGKQNLKLNSAKIMRALIMQIKPTDDDFKPYSLSIYELSQMLDVDSSNLYRRIDEITDDILKSHVSIKSSRDGHFLKLQWVSACSYTKGNGLTMKLNPLLKPFLLNLQEHYTQYQLENILAMKSIYSIRIYELMQREQMLKFLPPGGTWIVLTIQEIREACDCENKYEKISQFKAKVIDVAFREIMKTTSYLVEYTYLKKGRTTYAIRIHITSKFAL